MSVAIESGAAETLILHTMVAEYPIIETDKSRPGACYSSAIGKPIPNLGEQRLLLSTEEGSLRASKALRIRQTHSPSWPWCGIRRGWLVHSQQDYRRAEVVHVGCLNAQYGEEDARRVRLPIQMYGKVLSRRLVGSHDLCGES